MNPFSGYKQAFLVCSAICVELLNLTITNFSSPVRYLLQNMDWLEEELGGYDDDYLIFDCPGQIELYTHHPFLPTLVRNLSRMGIRTCATYLIESQFMEDKYKFFRFVNETFLIRSPVLIPLVFRSPLLCNLCFILHLWFSGVLSAMSAMVNLEVPWINIMSKMDLVTSNAEDSGSGRNGVRAKKDIARCVCLVYISVTLYWNLRGVCSCPIWSFVDTWNRTLSSSYQLQGAGKKKPLGTRNSMP